MFFIDVSGASDSAERKKRGTPRGIYAVQNDLTHMREPGSTKFTMAEINKATKNFSPTLKVGQGGFGTVYKGQLLDGTLVAVKRAKKVSPETSCAPKIHISSVCSFQNYIKLSIK